MKLPARVGIVGCGVISHYYAANAKAFDSFVITACADLDVGQAKALSSVTGIPVAEVDELLGDPSIDVVLNLTPASAHASVIGEALAAGKHVYTEKPLATGLAEAAELVAEAARLGLRIGCAPDTFLGAPYQAARAFIDAGAIGEPLAVAAAMLVGGQESWHPNPDIFFVDGAGPVLDMGPYYLTAIVAMLGSVRRVAAFSSSRTLERTIEIGPRAGERFAAETPTHVTAALELASGVTANLVTSFEAVGQYVCDLRIYGTEGVLELPDPNAFGGAARLKRGAGDWQESAAVAAGGREARGIGLGDMVEAIAARRPHRASADLGLHVVDVARGILRASAEGRTVDIDSRVDRPEPMPSAALV